MADYKGMYLKMFTVITEVIKILQSVQVTAEELFINQDKPQGIPLKRLDDSK